MGCDATLADLPKYCQQRRLCPVHLKVRGLVLAAASAYVLSLGCKRIKREQCHVQQHRPQHHLLARTGHTVTALPCLHALAPLYPPCPEVCLHRCMLCYNKATALKRKQYEDDSLWRFCQQVRY